MFTDDYMCYTYIKFFVLKIKLSRCIKHSSLGYTPSTGGEFYHMISLTSFMSQGTEWWLTTTNTPQHNGVAELLNRQLLEMAHAMLHHAQLPTFLWVEPLGTWSGSKTVFPPRFWACSKFC